jgi:hypothetical protein
MRDETIPFLEREGVTSSPGYPKGPQFVGSLSTPEPPEMVRGYSSFKRTAPASQPVKGLNRIQESFSGSDLLRCSFVADRRFVVRRDWNLARSGEPLPLF